MPAFPCLELGEIYADEQARVNGFSVQVGGVWQPGAPYRTEPPSEIRVSDPIADWPAKAAVAPSLAEPRPPLDGIRVLDLGQYIAGPFSTTVLADLGAEVIKLEPPQGDGLRPPTRGRQRPARSFAAGNRGKRAIALDLKDPETAPLIQALAASADVIHHNVRMAGVRRLGLDYESLSAARPELVYCHVDAYGAVGPRADWPGFDPLSQAASGWQMEAAGEGNAPMWLRNAYMDYHCGLAAAAATLLALYHRQATGRGQICGASLLGECLQSIGEVVMDADGQVSERPRLDAAQTGLGPFDRLYRCEDGRWVCACWPRRPRSGPPCWTPSRPKRRRRWRRPSAAGRANTPSPCCTWPACRPSRPLQDQLDAFLDPPPTGRLGPGAELRPAGYDWGRIEQVGGAAGGSAATCRALRPGHRPAAGAGRSIPARSARKLGADPELSASGWC